MICIDRKIKEDLKEDLKEQIVELQEGIKKLDPDTFLEIQRAEMIKAVAEPIDILETEVGAELEKAAEKVEPEAVENQNNQEDQIKKSQSLS
ncbi:MAG: hypothetical protein Barrevirus12_12 [Barrevirus sp.]|uniref:Uncharacterized protein n=1 Tax=Barrevirus sp. TaxID=2487763 RepID=A0A3G4ZU38_9VIRU|nr:MAG: hypothetical protein Barrevirus12_12 [Barrevirus sp.]